MTSPDRHRTEEGVVICDPYERAKSDTEYAVPHRGFDGDPDEGSEVTCSFCGGTGLEPSGVTYYGQEEMVGCHICGGTGAASIFDLIDQSEPIGEVDDLHGSLLDTCPNCGTDHGLHSEECLS